MKISTDSGAITFASGRITPDLSRSEFLRTPVGTGAEALRIIAPFATFRVRPETGVIASVRFREDSLEMVSVLFEMKDETEENWTRKRELERKAIHDQWLREEIGPPPYRYSWGDIESLFDEKACVSDIVVGYGALRVEKAWWQKDDPK